MKLKDLCKSCIQRNKISIVAWYIEPKQLLEHHKTHFGKHSYCGKTKKNNLYAIIIQYEITKFKTVILIPNKEDVTIEQSMMDEFILAYGSIEEIRTDIGTEYYNEIFA